VKLKLISRLDSDFPSCPDCEWQDTEGVWRTGVCDLCKRADLGDPNYACENCQGTQSPICCRCEGSGIDPEKKA